MAQVPAPSAAARLILGERIERAGILVVDASDSTQNAIATICEGLGHTVRVAGSIMDLREQLDGSNEWAILFVGLPLEDGSLDPEELVALVQAIDPSIQLGAVAPDPTVEQAKDIMRAGYLDCIVRPVIPAAVQRTVATALHVRRLALTNLALTQKRENDRRHFEGLLSHARAAILETRVNLEITYFNPAAERLLLLKPDAIGTSLLDQLYPDPDYAAGVCEIYEATILSGLVKDHVFTTTVRVGEEERQVRWSAGFYDAGGGDVRIINVGEDMSASGALEARVRSLITELNQKNHLLAATNNRNERLQTMVRQYIPKTVWERADLQAATGTVEIPIEKKELTCLFMDLAGFTSYTEQNETESVMRLLNQVFSGIAHVVYQFGGDIDKFMGDACFAVFEQPLNACKTALRVQRFIRRLNQRRNAVGLSTPLLRCGISTGSVIRGNVGGTERRDNTLIGDTVNTASRIESACRPGCVLISEATYGHVRQHVEVTRTESIGLKGKAENATVFYIHNIVSKKGVRL